MKIISYIKEWTRHEWPTVEARQPCFFPLTTAYACPACRTVQDGAPHGVCERCGSANIRSVDLLLGWSSSSLHKKIEQAREAKRQQQENWQSAQKTVQHIAADSRTQYFADAFKNGQKLKDEEALKEPLKKTPSDFHREFNRRWHEIEARKEEERKAAAEEALAKNQAQVAQSLAHRPDQSTQYLTDFRDKRKV